MASANQAEAGPRREIVVNFTQQQLELLDHLKRERTFGDSYGEIVANVFRDFVQRESKAGGA